MKEEQWMSELNVTVQHLGQVIGYTYDLEYGPGITSLDRK